MKKIACLGPKGTYSDIACRKYLEKYPEYEIEYYPSIIKAINEVDNDTIAIVPFENTLDGFVMETLDRIISDNLTIRSQINLDIDFAFISNCKDIKDVNEVYCQFKAYGQCLDFILNNDFNVIKTESNIDSFNRMLKSGLGFGAIVPNHVTVNLDMPLIIRHIADSKNNETRFFVVDNNKNLNEINDNYMASVVITSVVDRPGILCEILEGFHNNKINLRSILSRPDKTMMGKYNFFIEFNISKAQKNDFYDLIDKYNSGKDFKVKVLGIYGDM